MMRDFSLTVVPLREIFGSVECTSVVDGVMAETVMEFAQLPAFISEVAAPDDCIPVFATPGYSNRPWRRTRGRGPLEDVTFFVISELWHRNSRTRCFMLHQAQVVYELESTCKTAPIHASSPSLRHPTPILRTIQVGSTVTTTNTSPTDTNFSSGHCISQSGRGVVNAGDALFAISIQSFLSGSDKAPLITLDGQAISGKDVTMDPYSGAICCWSSSKTTNIQILYFD